MEAITLCLDWDEHLRDYSVLDIISLHARGLVTTEEIVASERHLSEFGTALSNHLNRCKERETSG